MELSAEESEFFQLLNNFWINANSSMDNSPYQTRVFLNQHTDNNHHPSGVRILMKETKNLYFKTFWKYTLIMTRILKIPVCTNYQEISGFLCNMYKRKYSLTSGIRDLYHELGFILLCIDEPNSCNFEQLEHIQQFCSHLKYSIRLIALGKIILIYRKHE